MLRHARYSNLKGCPIFEDFRADRYSNFSDRSIFKKLSGCSIFKLFAPLDIQILWAGAKSSGCSIFTVFGLFDILTFRPARYSNEKHLLFGLLDVQINGCSKFKVFGLLHMSYVYFPGRSILKVFGLLDHLTCLDSSIFKLFGLLDIQSFLDA